MLALPTVIAHRRGKDRSMRLMALLLPLLLLAGPVYGSDCSGTAPNDLCETGHPALTSSGLNSSEAIFAGTGTTARDEARTPLQGPLDNLRGGVRHRGAAVDGVDAHGA